MLDEPFLAPKLFLFSPRLLEPFQFLFSRRQPRGLLLEFGLPRCRPLLQITLTPEDIAAIETAMPKGAARGDRYMPQQMAHLDSERRTGA